MPRIAAVDVTTATVFHGYSSGLSAGDFVGSSKGIQAEKGRMRTQSPAKSESRLINLIFRKTKGVDTTNARFTYEKRAFGSKIQRKG